MTRRRRNLGPRLSRRLPAPGVPVEIEQEVAEADLAEDIFGIRPVVRSVLGGLPRLRLMYEQSGTFGTAAGLSRSTKTVVVITDARPGSVSDRLHRALGDRAAPLVQVAVYFVAEEHFTAACGLARLAGHGALASYEGTARSFIVKTSG